MTLPFQNKQSASGPRSSWFRRYSRPDAKSWLLHFSAVLVPVVLLLGGAAPWWTLSAGGILIVPTYLFLGYTETKRQEFWLTPMSFFFFWYSVGYGLSALYAASEAYQSGYLNLLARIVDAQDLAAGYVLSLCGALALHSGFIWVRRLRENKNGRPSEQRSDFRLWALLFLAGVAAIVRPEYLNSVGAARAILQLAPFGVMLSFCSFPKEYFRLSGPVYLSLFVLGNAILIAIGFYDGSKFLSMFAFLPLFSAMLVRAKWRKALPFTLAAGAALYLFVVAPILMRSRTIEGVDSKLMKLMIAAEETKVSLTDDPFFAFQDQGQKFLYRQFESTAVGFVVNDVREHGLQYGATMKNMGYAFIPRVLWPDKPVVSRGGWFTAYLGGSGSEEESATSTGIYSAGELYWNFGTAGVIFGMLIIGCLFGLLSAGIGPGPQRSIVPIVIFTNVIARIVDEATATEIVVLLVYLLLLMVAYRYFVHVNSKTLASVRTSRSPVVIRPSTGRPSTGDRR